MITDQKTLDVYLWGVSQVIYTCTSANFIHSFFYNPLLELLIMFSELHALSSQSSSFNTKFRTLSIHTWLTIEEYRNYVTQPNEDSYKNKFRCA